MTLKIERGDPEMTQPKLEGSLRTALIAAALLFGGVSEAIAADRVNTGYLGDIAILGYDPVAYFVEGRATKGSPEISRKWLGANWYFATTEHRDLFASQPTRYTPQYGGFCALGVAYEEASANVDPEAWRIVDGKLYLFSGKEGLEKDFDAAAADVIVKADTNWPRTQAAEFKARGEVR
jgi:YHS domain-containing protein